MDKEQVISNEAGFREEVKAFLAKYDQSFSPDYRILGIIGSQSSGKSTLLNTLFGTSFEVMNSNSQRKQTTKGIWISAVPSDDLFVLDIEGADSRERWQEKNAIEKKTALFGLVVSNLLIINLWLTEIGRFSAANYDIIKLIFEMNLQYFKRDSPKKLLFIIRDYYDDMNFDDLKNTLLTDVSRLWSEIKKPEGYERTELADLIAVNVISLRHYVHLRDGFNEDVEKLRVRFKKSSDDGIFRDYTVQNIPVDGLYQFLSGIWGTVNSNKDINIPNEKTVVSSFRCAEIKNEELNRIQPEITQLTRRMSEDPGFALGPAYKDLLSKSLQAFKKKTLYYDKTAVKEAEDSLSKEISKQFVDLFEIENSRVEKDLINELSANLKALTSGNFQLVDIMRSIAEIKASAKKNYSGFVDGFEFGAELRGEKVKLFDLHVSKVVNSFISNSASVVMGNWRKAVLSETDVSTQAAFRNITEESWDKLNEKIRGLVENFIQKIKELRLGSEEGKTFFSEEVSKAQEAQLIEGIKSGIRMRKNLIVFSMSEAFQYMFQTSSTGKPRNWKNLEEAEIEEIFMQNKSKFQPNLNFLASTIVFKLDDDVLFSKEEVLGLREQFLSNCHTLLQEAYNVKFDRNVLQRVPVYLWAVLAYFMHDNVLAWLRNPLFFVFFFGLVSLAAGIYFLGYTNLVIQNLRELYSRAREIYLQVFYNVPTTTAPRETAQLWNSSQPQDPASAKETKRAE